MVDVGEGDILLRLGMQHFKVLYRSAGSHQKNTAGEEEQVPPREELVYNYFEFLFMADMDLRTRPGLVGGIPLITDAEVLRYFHVPGYIPEFFVDPSYFKDENIPSSTTERQNAYWGALYGIRRHLCYVRVALESGTADMEAIEESISRLTRYIQNYRIWRKENFKPAPAPTNPTVDVERKGHPPIFMDGEQEEPFPLSFTVHKEESRNIFICTELAQCAVLKFPHSSKLRKALKELERMSDLYIASTFRLMNLIMAMEEGKNDPLLSRRFGRLTGPLTIYDSLPRGWRYLAGWVKRFPAYDQDLKRFVGMAKHLAWSGIVTARRISALEQEQENPTEVLAFLDTDRCISPTLEDFAETLEKGREAFENILPTPPSSPKISDFRPTLTNIFKPT
ncbi:hypothetical protein BT69DRAFT_1287831 [Atractiella rhizophila]|nr:hypothetical protein BT69DRAFT_1287831 [Atractiella rhizophila]